MANTYNYVDKGGKLQQVQADNLDSASKLATNRDVQSGFQLVTAPTTNITPSANTSAITMDQLTPPKPIQTPQLPPDTTNYGNYSKTAVDSLGTDLATLTAKRDAKRAEQEKNQKDIISSMEYIAKNKTSDTQTANDTAGVNSETEKLNKLIDELTNYNGQVKALDREATAIPIQVQNESAGLGVTDAGVAPDVNARLRNNALQALTIAQKADIASAAATGSMSRLTLAKEKAQQIIDLKYKPLEDTLNVKLKQYELNKDILDGIDKDRSESLASALNQQKAELENKKADEKAKMDLITSAAPFASADLLEKAKNAPDAASAAIILGPYGKDYLATQKTKQEIIKLKIENGTYNEADTGISALITKDNGFGIDDFKRGIAGVESAGSGGYSALGPVMAKSGDRAYGKYQVMGNNIPSWTKQALGYSMTPQQFLASPDAQEKVFEDQSNRNYAKYGNWDDVAAVWFSGKPLSGNTASDGSNTVPEYVKKVRKNMGITEPTKIVIPGVSDKVIQNVVRGKVAGGQLVSATTGEIPKNVSSTAIEDYGTLKELINATRRYKVVFEQAQKDGVFGTGVVTGIKNSVMPSATATKLDGIRGEITDILARFRSGAALTEYEQSQYDKKLPSIWASDQVFGNPLVTIDTLDESLSGILKTKLETSGTVFAPTQEEIYAKRIDASRNGGTSAPAGGNSDTYGYY